MQNLIMVGFVLWTAFGIGVWLCADKQKIPTQKLWIYFIVISPLIAGFEVLALLFCWFIQYLERK
jgi:hypothetical protein